MSLKEKVRFLGLGNYGCKQVKIFFDMGYKAMFANGSEQDLKIIGDVPNIFHLKGFDGFGGHRERALDCLAINKEFIEALQNITEEIVFVVYADGGSTGSGSAPICMEILLENNDGETTSKIICPINALPSSNESVVKHKNAYHAVQELQEIDGLGSAFFINNDASSDYSYINNTFARMLDAFLTNDSYGEINNFDESEKIEMLRNNGAMILSLVGTDKESSVLLEKLTKNGIFAPIESDRVCENIAIIHSGKDNSDITASDVIAEVGKPANVFEGYNNNGRSLVVASGLSYPVSHVRKLGELAQKVSEERQRSRSMSVQKLCDLEIDEPTVLKHDEKPVKKPSKLAALRDKQAKIQQH